MRVGSTFCAAICAAVFSLPASALAAVVYTNQSTFLSMVAPGAYTNTFNGLSSTPPTSFSGNGFGYTITAVSGTYSNGDFLGTNQPNQSLVFTFTSGNPTAIGGNFYATNISDAFVSTPLMFILTDGTTTTFTPSSTNDYLGFVSTIAIASITVSPSGAGIYNGIDNLTVGRAITAAAAPVPEPETWSLLIASAGAILVGRRSRRSTPIRAM